MLEFRYKNNDMTTVLIVGSIFLIHIFNSLCCSNTTKTLTNRINLIMIQLCFDNNSYVILVQYGKTPRNISSVSIIEFIFTAINSQKILDKHHKLR